MSLLHSDDSDNQENVDAVTGIFIEHGPFIRAVLDKQVRNKTDVEDLHQNLFVSLLRHPVPDDVNNIRAFLYRAIVNDIINFKKQRQRYQSKLFDLLEVLRGQQTQIEPVEKHIELEKLAITFGLIEKLRHQRFIQAVELRYKEDRSSEETARIMGVSKRTVDSYVSIGLRKLREFMAREYGDEHDSS